MGLVKALILVVDPKDPSSVKEQIKVLFNPEEYTLNKDNNFASQAVPGLRSPLLQFVNGNLSTLDMELFFDTLDKGVDVRSETDKIIKLQAIKSDIHGPPILRFVWASLDFTCVLTRVSQKFLRFLQDGKPVRARLTVSFSEFVDADREAKEVNRQTADFTKFHVVIKDETLSSIAGKFYDNPQLWRPIAIENSIDDPRSIFPGQALRIPSLPFFNQESGEVIK
jgi:Contractile injection system tube protein/LysM domain